MVDLITDRQLTEVNDLLDRGDKNGSVDKIKNILILFFQNVQEEQGPWSYMGDTLGKNLQDTVERIRNECPDECNASGVEVLQFKLGDRVYGYNLDESGVLFLLGPSLGPGNLIIDHLNDHYREGGALNEAITNVYGSPAWLKGANDLKKGESSLIKEYLDFYQKMPKLSSLPRKEVNDDLDQETGILMINRACKAGILKTVLAGNIIHFNLDHFISDSRFSERAIMKGDKKGESIPGFYTVKELRFIKRLHDFDPNLSRHIKFYQNGAETPAPWVTNPKDWEAYQRKGTQGLETTLDAIKKDQTPSVVGKLSSVAGIAERVASEAITMALANASEATEQNSSRRDLS